MFTISSLLIAFVAAAGAIPLCRSFVQKSTPAGRTGELIAAPRVAGAGMLFGACVSLFYLGVNIYGATALLGSGLFLVLAGTWLERQEDKEKEKAPYPLGTFAFQWAVSTIAGLAVVIPASFGTNGWTLSSSVLAAMVMVTPVAVSFLGPARFSNPALPLAVTLVQLVALLVFGAWDALDRAASVQHYGIFSTIALPAVGALLGALVYLCRMPWRSRAFIAVGAATPLCLGLLVAWGAVGLASGPGEQTERTAALLWILAVPVFEILRRHIMVILAPLVRDGDGTRKRHVRRFAHHSAASIVLFASMFGTVGLVFWHLQVPEAWGVFTLIPALLVYSAAPIFMPPWSRTRPSSMVDAHT